MENNSKLSSIKFILMMNSMTIRAACSVAMILSPQSEI